MAATRAAATTMNIPNVSTAFMDVHAFTGEQLIKFEYSKDGWIEEKKTKKKRRCLLQKWTGRIFESLSIIRSLIPNPLNIDQIP